MPAGFVEGLEAGSNPIQVLELAAAYLGLQKGRGACVAAGRPLNIALSKDNNSALSTLLKGYSRHDLPTSIAQSFWALQSEFRIPVWLDRVRTQYNLADRPSRCSAGATAVTFPSINPAFG